MQVRLDDNEEETIPIPPVTMVQSKGEDYAGARSARNARNRHRRQNSGMSSQPSSTRSNNGTSQFWINCLEDSSNGTSLDHRRHSMDSRRSSLTTLETPKNFDTAAEPELDFKENELMAEDEKRRHSFVNLGREKSSTMLDIRSNPSYEEDASTLAGTKLVASLESLIPNGNNVTKSVETSETNSNDEDPFRWAYDIWKKRGLMHHSRGNSKRAVAKRITYLQGRIWNEKLVGKASSQDSQESKKTPAKSKSYVTPRNSFSFVTRGSFDDVDDEGAKQPPRVTPLRQSLPASVHASTNHQRPATSSKKKNFSSILQKWRDKSDDRPCSHFLSPEMSHQPRKMEQPRPVIEPIFVPPAPESRSPESAQDLITVEERESDGPSIAETKTYKSSLTPVATEEATEETSNEDKVMKIREEASTPANTRRSISTRRTSIVLQKKRGEELPKEPKPDTPQSQASRIKARYMDIRHPSRSRSRGRLRSLASKESSTGGSSATETTKSPPRSRGNFKAAVQSVLYRVDTDQQDNESRPLSAPRSCRNASSKSSNAPHRPKSAPRAGRNWRDTLRASRSFSAQTSAQEPIDFQLVTSKSTDATDRPDSSASTTTSQSKPTTKDPPGTITTSIYQPRKPAEEQEELVSNSADQKIGESKFDKELKRAVSAPRLRRSDEKPKPEHATRLGRIRANRLARQAELSRRSKSTPRSEKSPVLKNANVGSFDADDTEKGAPSPDARTPVRVRDLLKLNTSSSFVDSHRARERASVPSQVEIKLNSGNDDDDISLADSKLTDNRTDVDAESSSLGVPLNGESPWTVQMLTKLEEFQVSSKETSPKRITSNDRPWRSDRLKKRMSSISDKPSMSGGDDSKCQCAKSVLTEKDEMIDFFLPLLGSGCTCGKTTQGLVNPDEPTAIENILRPWQVEFLAAFGIYRGDQMVKAHHRSASALASALRQYRKRKNMTSFRTKSCSMALEIWSKTCRAFVRSIRKQLEAGTTQMKLPNTLYILSSFLERLPSDETVDQQSVSASTVLTNGRSPSNLRERANQMREARRQYQRHSSSP